MGRRVVTRRSGVRVPSVTLRKAPLRQGVSDSSGRAGAAGRGPRSSQGAGELGPPLLGEGVGGGAPRPRPESHAPHVRLRRFTRARPETVTVDHMISVLRVCGALRWQSSSRQTVRPHGGPVHDAPPSAAGSRSTRRLAALFGYAGRAAIGRAKYPRDGRAQPRSPARKGGGNDARRACARHTCGGAHGHRAVAPVLRSSADRATGRPSQRHRPVGPRACSRWRGRRRGARLRRCGRGSPLRAGAPAATRVERQASAQD